MFRVKCDLKVNQILFLNSILLFFFFPLLGLLFTGLESSGRALIPQDPRRGFTVQPPLLCEIAR